MQCINSLFKVIKLSSLDNILCLLEKMNTEICYDCHSIDNGISQILDSPNGGVINIFSKIKAENMLRLIGALETLSFVNEVSYNYKIGKFDTDIFSVNISITAKDNKILLIDKEN